MIYEAKTTYKQVTKQQTCPPNLSRFAISGTCNSSNLSHGDKCNLSCPEGFEANLDPNITRPTCSCFTSYSSILTLSRSDCIWLKDDSQVQCVPVKRDTIKCPNRPKYENSEWKCNTSDNIDGTVCLSQCNTDYSMKLRTKNQNKISCKCIQDRNGNNDCKWIQRHDINLFNLWISI